jgi:DNA 3'-phosphatase
MKMTRYEVLFADLDGTLIETISGETFPRGIWDMKIRFDVLDKIKELEPKYILIPTNQGGIEKGFIDECKFRHKLEYICSAIKEYCGCKNVFSSYCASNDKADPNRKPNTGMLAHLTETFVGDDFDHIKLKSLMIGDASGKEGQFSDSDKKCAENFGIDYLDVDDFVRL